MDITTRGIISATIEYVFENQNVLDTIEWMFRIDDDVISREDLALGYFMGSLMNISNELAIDVIRWNIIDKMDKEFYINAFGKEEGLKKYIENKMRREESKESGTNYTKIQLSEEDTEAIRNMLIPMITRFREKIRQEKVLERI